VCVLAGRIPYAYSDRHGDLKGLDIEMAHRLAHDLGVSVEFLTVTLEQLPGLLDRGSCDLGMSGIPVTPLRASTMSFSAPYLDETLGWVVRDHLRNRFESWDTIAAIEGLRIGAIDAPYYLTELHERAPALRFERLSPDVTDEAVAAYDAFLIPAERGSVWTLLHPEFTVVVPRPDRIKVPLAYPLFRHGERWEQFVNTWIELKRRDATLDRLYRHWILGQDAVDVTPRWSVVRSVLHWVP
jgi:ABC-type amino acid transport substrate-binding protein